MGRLAVKIELPYVQAFVKRGVFFAYYRRDGQRIRLHGNPTTSEWKRRYHEIHDNWRRDDTAAYATVRWVLQEYRKADRYLDLKPASKKSYDRYLTEIEAKYGAFDWRKLDRPTVIAIRDKHRKPSTRRAKYFVQLLSILGEVAIDKGLRPDNPAKGVETPKTKKHWRRWEPEELLWFEGVVTAPAPRLAYFLALYTGQRLADVLTMRWNAVKNGMVEVVQSKTDEPAFIPIYPVLAEELSNATKRGVTIVAREDGQPYTESGFTTLWRRHVLSAGLDGVQFHGLRKNAASALAEVGCTEDEIKAITGHRTSQMVSLYTREARQKLLAESAMRKMTNRPKRLTLASQNGEKSHVR